MLGTLPAQDTPQNKTDPVNFFERTNLTQFHVELDRAEYEQLLRPRQNYVSGRVSVDDRVFEKVGIRLKGRGTFQPISKNPNLTLNFNWTIPDQEYAGLTKLFLENSSHDPTLLCKLVASAAYATTGIPAPRITHARVRLNGRDLGIYVVSEAVNKRFLKHHFGNAQGNLYEGEFQDINGKLDQDNGTVSDYSDLRQLLAATWSDRSLRRQRLAEVLAVEQFLNFLAVEMIIANWDSYAFYQNNYRIYHNPDSKRMVFIPHGFDNTFSESSLSLMPPRNSLLVSALLETSAEREAFRQRVATLAPKVLHRERIRTQVWASVVKLQQGTDSKESQTIEQRATLLLQRIEARAKHLEAELAGHKPSTPIFNGQGVAAVTGWIPKTDWHLSPLEVQAEHQKPMLAISTTGDRCSSSWRLPVWLPAGYYCLEGSVRTARVFGLPSRTGSGAGVRVLGTMRSPRVNRVNGDTPNWVPVIHIFVVQEGCEWVELIAELRAYQGSAWFDAESLRLTRIQDSEPVR